MGGKGSGGARRGAGRKPKTGKQHWLSGDAGKRNLALVPSRTDSAIDGGGTVVPFVPPPDAPLPNPDQVVDLASAESRYRQQWEPLATRNGTLTDQTRPGFALLCQVAARTDAMWAQIGATNFMSGERAHPLMTHYRGLMQRQEQLLARYGLAAIGVSKDAGKSDEDDELDELQRLMAVK